MRPHRFLLTALAVFFCLSATAQPGRQPANPDGPFRVKIGECAHGCITVTPGVDPETGTEFPKGTVLHISEKTIELMTAKYRCNAADIRAVLGPSIGPDSFQVGEEVAEHFKNAKFPMDQIWSFQGEGDGTPMSGGHHIDLWKANKWLLEQAGVKPENIQVCGIDTFTDEAFFSARREGVQCGRIINSIKLV